jgi:tetratricopeptide (TPR) repeat protein
MPISMNVYRLVPFIFCLIIFGCAPKEPPLEEVLAQADLMLDSGQADAALTLLEAARERAGERVDILEPMAYAHLAAGDPLMAAMTFARVAELAPELPEYQLFAAHAFVEAGDPRGGAQRYRAYLEQYPEDRAVWVALAELEAEQGRQREALEAYLQAENVQSRTQQQLAIAELYLRLDNQAQAQAWYARALEGDSTLRQDALVGLLETAVRARRFADASELLEQIDRMYPDAVDDAGMADIRPQLRQWQGRREEALAAARELEQANAQARERAAAADASSTAETVTEQQAAAADDAALATPQQEPAAGAADEPAADVAADQPTETATEQSTDTAARPAQAQVAQQPEQAEDARAAGTDRRAAPPPVAAEDPIARLRAALVEDDTQAELWAELSAAYLQAGEARWAQVTASEAMRREPEQPRFALLFLAAARTSMDDERFMREMENTYRRFREEPDVVLFAARVFDERGNARTARRLYIQFSELPQAAIHPAMPFVRDRLRSLAD